MTPAPGIEARAVAFAYGGRRILEDVSLSLAAGEVVSLLGPNGAGKSTLLRLLLGMLRPDAGEILLEGRPLSAVPLRERAGIVAYVPQIHQVTFPFRAEDVVLMGRLPRKSLLAAYDAEDRRLAREALRRLSIEHLAGSPYHRLSGGERQLVLIARALAQGARYFVMDEPVGGLDFGNQIRLLDRIRRMADEGFGFVKSTHFPDHALHVSDRALLLHDGKLCASGAPAAVITAENIRRLYGVEVDVLNLPRRPVVLPKQAAAID
ncbi:MAG: ABC transporter ATP-binding protein [Burkholderiales bacterium]|nr:ABC transporter ATP-binding protein [Burkholderiales bacterium]OJX07724.1 MAG: hypothetical protein BGO72_18400 [Burkholderiales bacterium 70-64]